MNAPDDYLVIDTETTNNYNAYVVQFGMCYVVGGQVKQSSAFLIQLPDDVRMEPKAFESHGLSRAHLNYHGLSPYDAFSGMREIVTNGNHTLVGQNLPFDLRAINFSLKYVGLPAVDFSKRTIMDTGLVYKADQTGERPEPGEDTYQFFNRVSDHPRRGVRWNLDLLLEKFNIGKREGKYHDAAEDIVLTNKLYRVLRDEGYFERVLNGERSDDRGGPGLPAHGADRSAPGPVGGRVHADRGSVLPY